MILSDNDITSMIESGDIVIDGFQEENVKGGSYTFTLNNVLSIPKVYDCIDVHNTKVEYEQVVIPEDGYIIQPGKFLLGQTKEQVSISQKIACFLDARTTLARIGLNALQGSTFIEPGQSQSHETLEIINVGTSPIKIYAGMKIVKGIFVLLNTSADQDYSKTGTYAQQKNPDAKII